MSEATKPPVMPEGQRGQALPIVIGAVGLGVAVLGALTAPPLAPIAAAAGALAGAAAGWMLSRRRGAPAAAKVPPEIERLEDRAWELNDFVEHYRSLAEGLREAEAASAAKSRFLATVSHELRNPLNGMLGLTGVLMETALTAEQETFARAVRTAGELMLGLVDDLLDFAKIEAGRFELLPEPIDVAALAEEVVELFASRAEAKGLDLATDIDRETPSRIVVDGPRLRQVLVNLVANAVKFTDRGGVVVRVGPEPSPGPGRLAFAVEDTGPGVPAELADRIFHEFEQAAGDPRRRAGGSGLGLAIAQRIVGAMGGRITVGAREGGGAVFGFSLAPGLDQPASGRRALTDRRGLIVAPEGPAPMVLAAQLDAAGASTSVAPSLSQAAALAGAAAAADEPYDFVLLDQRLGADTGGLLATLRGAAGRRLPAALLIPPGRRPSVAEMRGAGFDAYLVRPVRRSSLIRIAEHLVGAGRGFTVDPTDRKAVAVPRRPAGSGLKVLVLEDDEIGALLLRSVLQRLGHDVVEVRDADRALEMARAAAFDVILLDLNLPAGDGIGVAAEVRASEQRSSARRVALIAITADIRPDRREAALAAGFDSFLQKPVTPDALRQAIAALTVPSAA